MPYNQYGQSPVYFPNNYYGSSMNTLNQIRQEVIRVHGEE